LRLASSHSHSSENTASCALEQKAPSQQQDTKAEEAKRSAKRVKDIRKIEPGQGQRDKSNTQVEEESAAFTDAPGGKAYAPSA
jgi:hypothetical protein